MWKLFFDFILKNKFLKKKKTFTKHSLSFFIGTRVFFWLANNHPPPSKNSCFAELADLVVLIIEIQIQQCCVWIQDFELKSISNLV